MTNITAIFVRMTLIIVILISLLPQFVADDGNIREKIVELYREIVYFAKNGLEVSHLVGKLDKVLELMHRGDNNIAREILVEIEQDVKKLRSEAPNAILYKRISKSIIIGLLVLIPITFYVLFPRIYLCIWFKTRRKWVVKTGATR